MRLPASPLPCFVNLYFVASQIRFSCDLPRMDTLANISEGFVLGLMVHFIGLAVSAAMRGFKVMIDQA